MTSVSPPYSEPLHTMNGGGMSRSTPRREKPTEMSLTALLLTDKRLLEVSPKKSSRLQGTLRRGSGGPREGTCARRWGPPASRWAGAKSACRRGAEAQRRRPQRVCPPAGTCPWDTPVRRAKVPAGAWSPGGGTQGSCAGAGDGGVEPVSVSTPRVRLRQPRPGR